MMRFIQ